MRRLSHAFLACALVALILSGCDVPTPPPEIPTPTPGSSVLESDQSRSQLTPVRATPDRGYTPVAGPPGDIYFVRASHLWTISPDGSGERQLSNLPITDTPEPSPDGKSVAWIGGRDLYVMPSAGGDARKLYTGDLTERQRIGWSPDGKLLGFFTYDLTTAGTEKAWSIPLAGGDPSLITTFTGSMGDRGATYERCVKWSPDHNWVVVGAVNNPSRLLRWPLSTGHDGDVTDIAGGEPDWSPDSRTLLYTETLGGAVLVYSILDSKATPFRNEKLFVGTGMGEYAQGPGPIWSPASIGADSDLLIYRSRSLSGEPNIAVRNRAGTDYPSLPNLTNNASWSPNGDSLVVETGVVTNGDLGLEWSPNALVIATINLTGGDHKLTPLVKDASMPAWGK
jgi:Tol biopolymer transport system component